MKHHTSLAYLLAPLLWARLSKIYMWTDITYWTCSKCLLVSVTAETHPCQRFLVQRHRAVERKLNLPILLLRRAGQSVPEDRCSHCPQEELESRTKMPHFVPMRSTLNTRCMCLGISTAVSSWQWVAILQSK